jgi:hypothetical protein
VFGRTGSYDVAWGALVAIGLAALILQWLMDDRSPTELRRAGSLQHSPA